MLQGFQQNNKWEAVTVWWRICTWKPNGFRNFRSSVGPALCVKRIFEKKKKGDNPIFKHISHIYDIKILWQSQKTDFIIVRQENILKLFNTHCTCKNNWIIKRLLNTKDCQSNNPGVWHE